MHPRILLTSILILGSTQAGARSWVSLKGGASADFRKAAISAGSHAGSDQEWGLQGSFTQSQSSLVNSNGLLVARELGLGGGYYPLDQFWDLSLDLSGGNDSSDTRFGGGSATLGLNAKFDSVKTLLSLNGGAEHFLFAPEESLRQDSGGLGLSFNGDFFSIGASTEVYRYNREIVGPGQSGSSSSTIGQPGGLFGLLPPTGSSTVATPGGPGQQDPFLPGFPTRDWSARLGVNLGSGAEIGGNYSQTELLGSGTWVKVAGGYWRQELNSDLVLRLGGDKAVEGGSDGPYFSGAFTWSFGSYL